MGLEDWAEISAADEIAQAERDNPRSRPNVVSWIVKNGGVRLALLKERYHPDDIKELRGRVPVGFWRKEGQGLDTLAQEMNYLGIPSLTRRRKSSRWIFFSIGRGSMI
jgi:hypothetical protein